MAERNDVVDRADALMRGRRSFVGTPARAASLPGGDDDDLPVLTEVVLPAAEPEPHVDTGTPAAAAPTYSEADLNALGREMAQAIAQQLHFELPTLVEAAMASATDELRAGIASTIDSAVRDFIAQQKTPKN